MNVNYPPVAFYFQLNIPSISKEEKATFKEVSGISAEMRSEEIIEGGENRFAFKLPTTVKYSNLVLKRGLVKADSALIKWCRDSIDGGLSAQIQPKTIILHLLDDKNAPIKTWTFTNAWPVKWSVSDLNAMNNELLVETVEFAYSYFELK